MTVSWIAGLAFDTVELKFAGGGAEVSVCVLASVYFPRAGMIPTTIVSTKTKPFPAGNGTNVSWELSGEIPVTAVRVVSWAVVSTTMAVLVGVNLNPAGAVAVTGTPSAGAVAEIVTDPIGGECKSALDTSLKVSKPGANGSPDGP
jgi:hypothetical protein